LKLWKSFSLFNHLIKTKIPSSKLEIFCLLFWHEQDARASGGVTIEDKTTIEQMQLIQQLDEEDKQTIFKLIDKMLTTKKFKDFFQKNVATL
jgi:hypothetical protein